MYLLSPALRRYVKSIRLWFMDFNMLYSLLMIVSKRSGPAVYTRIMEMYCIFVQTVCIIACNSFGGQHS